MKRLRPARLGPRDLLHVGLVGIRTRKLRAVLSALGISISIATIVVVSGAPASSSRALEEELTKLGTDVIQVLPASTQQLPVQLPEQSVAMVDRIGPVTVASAVGNTATSLARTDLVDLESSSSFAVLASKPDLLTAVNGRVRSGRFLTSTTEALPVVVLGATAATRLGIEEIPDGEAAPLVFIDHAWFSVVGILRPVPLAPDLDSAALVGWTAAKQELGFDGHPTVIYLKALEAQLDAVRDVLPATVYPELPGLVQVSRPSDALSAKRSAQQTFSALIVSLAGVALLVGGIGVANTMVISVLERRREIGLRRALGASRAQIAGQFLTESVVLSLLGGAAGATLGVLAVAGYATYQDWPVVIALSAVLQGLGGALVVGVLAGVYPSFRAARLTPTEALAAT